MANNSLTERVLSANERGLTVDEICVYENLPLEDVEHILRYWKSEYHAGTRRRQMKVDDFIRRRGADSLQEFVERVSRNAPSGSVRVHVATEMAHRYNINADVAADVVDEIYLMMDNLRNESRTARRNTHDYISRIRHSA